MNGLATEEERGGGFQGNLSFQNERSVLENLSTGTCNDKLAFIFFVADLNKKFDYFTIKIDGKIIKYTFSYNMSQRHFTKFVSNLRIFQEIIL